MNEIHKKRILYVAEELDKLLEILGTAAEIIMTELEEAPSDENSQLEDEEYEAIWDVMVFVERLERDWNTLCSVKNFSATQEQEICQTCKH